MPANPAAATAGATSVVDEDLDVFHDHYKEVFMPLVDWRQFNRYAIAFVDPAALNPGVVLQAALFSEQLRNGDRTQIRPSSMGAGVVVFDRPFDCDTAVDGLPVPVMEYSLHFERPQDTDNSLHL